AGYLIASEEPSALVLATDGGGGGGQDVTAVGHDDDVAPLADVVLPAVQEGADSHIPACFLSDLANHAVARGLPDLQLAAGQFPFVPLVLQQQHLAVLDRDALDRYRELAHAWAGRHGHARLHRTDNAGRHRS